MFPRTRMSARTVRRPVVSRNAEIWCYPMSVRDMAVHLQEVFDSCYNSVRVRRANSPPPPPTMDGLEIERHNSVLHVSYTGNCNEHIHQMRSEVSMAMLMKIDTFRDAQPCCLVEFHYVSRENIACIIRAAVVSKIVTTPTVNAGIYAYQGRGQ